MIPAKYNLVIADSSFYICFLEDIKRYDILIIMIDNFHFGVGDKIQTEISRCSNYNKITNNDRIALISGIDFSEPLKPFLSKLESEKGEGEAIALAAILHGIGRLDMMIIDEYEQRLFFERVLPHLKPPMNGTAGFVGKCCSNHKLFDKATTLQILDEIEHSPFRVSKEVLSEVRSLFT